MDVGGILQEIFQKIDEHKERKGEYPNIVYAGAKQYEALVQWSVGRSKEAKEPMIIYPQGYPAFEIKRTDQDDHLSTS